jgi:peptide-methionine (R)-S-oxide reductase
MVKKIRKTEAEWKKDLDPEVFHVTREGGTEAPFTGKYHDNKELGMYTCSNCGFELFSSDAKFDSGTGWPSFDRPADREHLEVELDESHGLMRQGIVCARCGAHLGHVFDDGPTETKARYCVNSLALNFEDTKSKKGTDKK